MASAATPTATMGSAFGSAPSWATVIASPMPIRPTEATNAAVLAFIPLVLSAPAASPNRQAPGGGRPGAGGPGPNYRGPPRPQPARGCTHALALRTAYSMPPGPRGPVPGPAWQ